MDLGLADRRVLVTGATRGIGRATALAFARAGARVVGCHRQAGEAADSLARDLKDLGDGHRVVQADVTDPEEVTRLLEACRETLGGLDVVVNNAGVDGHGEFDTLPAAEWARVLDVNITAYYLVVQAALPLLAEGASVVNVGASVATRGRPGSAHYTASKAAVVGLTRSLCKEFGGRGIRVNIVAPGVIETEPDAGLPPEIAGRLRAMTALGRLGAPEDVADPVLFLASDAARHITGTTLTVDGGV